MDDNIPKIEYEPGVYERLDRYLSAHSDEDIESVGEGGPNYKTDLDEDEPRFFLICAYRKFDPEKGFSYLNLADAFLANGLFDEARKIYKALKQINYDFNGFHDSPDFHLGWLETDLENFEQALKHFDFCLSEYPQARNQILPYLAMLHHKWGRYKEAVSFYDQHLKNFGKDELERALEMQGLDQPAKEALEILRDDASHARAFRGKLEWPLNTCGLEELGKNARCLP